MQLERSQRKLPGGRGISEPQALRIEGRSFTNCLLSALNLYICVGCLHLFCEFYKSFICLFRILIYFLFFWLRHVAFRILVSPLLGIKPTLLAVEAWNPNHWTAREVPKDF